MGFEFHSPLPTGITLACNCTTHVMTAYKWSNLTVTDRVTVHEAAKRLGVSEGAVRQRLHRGKLKTDKDDTGRVYVYLTADDYGNNTVNTPQSTDSDLGLLDELRDRIRFLEDELTDRKEESRRKDTIIGQMNQTVANITQRIPELEAATEPRESVVSAPEGVGNGAVPKPPADGQIRKSWWQRLFAG